MGFAPLPSLDSSLALEAEGQSRKIFLLWTKENTFRQMRGLQAIRDVCRREKHDREEKACTLEKVMRPKVCAGTLTVNALMLLFSSPAPSFDPLSFPNHRCFVCAPALFPQASHNPPLVNQISKPLCGGSRCGLPG